MTGKRRCATWASTWKWDSDPTTLINFDIAAVITGVIKSGSIVIELRKAICTVEQTGKSPGSSRLPEIARFISVLHLAFSRKFDLKLLIARNTIHILFGWMWRMLFHVNTKKKIIYCNYNILQTYTAHLPRSLTSSVVQDIRPLFMFRLLGTFYLCRLAAHRRCICRYTSLRIVHVQRRRKRTSFNATPHLDLPVPPRRRRRRVVLGALSALLRQSASDLAGSRGLFYEYA